MTKLNLTSLPMLPTDMLPTDLGKSEWEETCFIMTSLL